MNEAKYKLSNEVYWDEGRKGFVNDIYESPTTGEIVYELREVSGSNNTVMGFPLVREDDIPKQEGGDE